MVLTVDLDALFGNACMMEKEYGCKEGKDKSLNAIGLLYNM